VEEAHELFELNVAISIDVHSVEQLSDFDLVDTSVAFLQQAADFVEIQDPIAVVVMLPELPPLLRSTSLRARQSSADRGEIVATSDP